LRIADFNDALDYRNRTLKAEAEQLQGVLGG
jgi:hypothetical protein